ncbi:hypothetical protein KC19_9G042500 [Ceratodon purpureus]|uniref:glycerophosphodiester phosphodiesterase n=1 Tax=Ceratodon purpureus TaxID=3225 RepID=A0A8T0GQH4_CERPU|nr:hypothetical protein KC19_9G042500 [Ceratodon purpureus]
MKIMVLLLLVTLPACLAYNATLGWQTLLQGPPLIIANGGSSGMFPDQTDPAYYDAANSSKIPLAMLCDLQLTKDNLGVCRTGWNLSASTNLTNILTNTSVPSTYVIQGVSRTGFFSVDFNLTELNQTTAIQQNPARSPDSDGIYPILTPEYIAGGANNAIGLFFWLNVEYPSFYQQHPGKNSLASYLTTFLKAYKPAYVSATEVGILKLLQLTATRTQTYLVLKFLDKTAVEESTNTTYGAILSNLADVATYASGILVPKSYIYATRVTPATTGSEFGYFVDGASTLVQEAHKANLEVFVYGFANDVFPSSYNYSFDPVFDSLSYIGNSFQIDGFLTDFPNTASEAINCYPEGYVKAPLASRGASKSVKNPVIISHNGASGDFPGCTMAAYVAAINDGADYIDCSVQITSDGVAICRENVDLLPNTNIFSNQALYQQYVATYPELQATPGVFSFNLSYADVSTLKAVMYSPWGKYLVSRDPSNDGVENILTLDDFLSFAKNNSGIGIYVNLQNAYYLRTVHNLDLVDAVVTSLTKANLTNASDKVFVASEDSSALAALQNLMPAVKTVYVVPYSAANPYSVTPAVLQEIKQYANTVSIDWRLIDPLDTFSGFLLQKTSVVSAAQALNMTVFYSFLSNEFVAYARDYRSDPILQIYSLISEFKLDGLITDFPSTLYNFLNKNYCYQSVGGQNISMSTQNYPIFPVAPVSPFAMAPSPALSVAEPPVSYLVPTTSPGGPSIAPGPSANPSSATKLPVSLVATVALILILTFIL